MGVQITIPDSLFKILQKHAIPLVDTPVSVIERWARHFERTSDGSSRDPKIPIANPDLDQPDPDAPPDLLHTRVRGTFGAIAFPNWNGLLRIAHVEAFKKAKSFEALRTATHAPIYNGNRSDCGFHYLPEVGISLQTADANHAWRYALRLARFIGTPLRASVDWRNKEKAAHRGKSCNLSWQPESGTPGDGREAILDVLRKAAAPMRCAAIARAANLVPHFVSNTCWTLERQGILRRVAHGVYEFAG